jgi:putative two-component system response regulator
MRPEPSSTPASQAAQLNSNSAGTFAKHAKMKILIVDDEPANVALLEDLLEEHGYTRVMSITDSRNSIRTCNEFQPDLILLDLMMPHIDGLTILETIRTQNPDMLLPVLVLTADINEQTKLRALHAGATDFLLKPFDHVEALLRIRNLLEIRKLHIQIDTQRAAFEDALHVRTAEVRDMKLQLNQAAWRSS